jgi:IS5 family transposase
LAEALFAELNRQLDAQGLVLKAGTLIDATLVEASVARPPQSEGEVSILDPDAGFTRRGQRSFFGFKAHLAVDLGSDLVRGAILTGADVGDSLAADALVQGDEDAVFADKAYDSAARREALAEAGIVDAIMYRGHARRPLAPWQRWMNAALAPIRGQVERAFGTLKRSYGWRRVRYRGLARNGAHLHLLCTAMNLRRAERLAA